MLLVQNILVSESILEEEFVCNLQKCHGACCWEGDYGAPLEPDEIASLEEEMHLLESYMLPESYAYVVNNGPIADYKEPRLQRYDSNA